VWATLTALTKARNGLRSEQLEEAHAANRENRRIIAGLVQRVPELEAPPEPRDAPETASENEGKDQARPEGQGQEKRSWWRRLFDPRSP
jgi:hypothetical protein